MPFNSYQSKLLFKILFLISFNLFLRKRTNSKFPIFPPSLIISFHDLRSRQRKPWIARNIVMSLITSEAWLSNIKSTITRNAGKMENTASMPFMRSHDDKRCIDDVMKSPIHDNDVLWNGVIINANTSTITFFSLSPIITMHIQEMSSSS